MRGNMKAAVVEGPGSMTIMDVPIPLVKEETVLIKVLACAVCGSDIRILDTGEDLEPKEAALAEPLAYRINGLERAFLHPVKAYW